MNPRLFVHQHYHLILTLFIVMCGIVGMTLLIVEELHQLFDIICGPMGFVLMPSLSFTVMRSLKYCCREKLRYAIPFSALISIASALAHYVNILEEASYAHMLVIHIFAAVLIAPLFSVLCCSVLKHLDSLKLESSTVCNRSTFFYMWGGMMLLWLPYLLALWPGNTSFDLIYQSQYLLTGEHIWAHFPALHTLWMTIPMSISNQLCGSYVPGFQAYILSQYILMAGILSYICVRVWNWGSKTVSIVCWAFFSLFVGTANYSVVATKDSMFAAVYALTIVLLIDYCRGCSQKEHVGKRISETLPILFASLITALLRHNFAYALVPIVIISPFVLRSNSWKRLTGTLLLTVILSASFSGPFVLGVLGAKPGSKAEMLSVPMQQMAFVMNEHGKDELSEECRRVCELYVPGWRDYDRYLADPVKDQFNIEAFEDSPSKFFKEWAFIGLEYPKDYMLAFLHMTVGYWSPVTNYSGKHPAFAHMSPFVVNQREPSDKRPANEYIYIDQTPAVPGILVLLRIASKLHPELLIPGFNCLYQTGFWVWLSVFILYFWRYKHNLVRTLPVLVNLIYLCTMLLGPVSLFRYALPIILASAVLFADLISSHANGGMAEVSAVSGETQ